MKVKFREYQGLAGELDVMLICESEKEYRVDCFYKNVGWFAQWNLKRAKKS